jgi:ABC-type anion transport system duplicated permease subunit
VAHGLGAYIAEATAAGDYPAIMLGIAVMSLFVTLFNRLLWRPLYRTPKPLRAWIEERAFPTPAERPPPAATP